MASEDDFTRHGLAAAVARVCAEAGWDTASGSALRTMTDVLHEYCAGLARAVKMYSEISNTNLIGNCIPDIEDVTMAFNDRHIRLVEIRKYLKYQQNSEIEHPTMNNSLPQYPHPAKSSTLNMMKPGSREIVTRPVHVHEHLPTMYHVEQQLDEKLSQNYDGSDLNKSTNNSWNVFDGNNVQENNMASNNVGDRSSINNRLIVPLNRRLRDISSVVMTTSGYLSPSREGRLPESRLILPSFSSNSLSSKTSSSVSSKNISRSTELPIVKSEKSHQPRHIKKPSQKFLIPNHSMNKEKINLESNNNKNDNTKISKKHLKDELPKKSSKGNGILRRDNNSRNDQSSKNRDKLKTNALNAIFDRSLPTTSNSPQSNTPLSNNSNKRSKNSYTLDSNKTDSEKLNSEPDKRKLNIFKKISTKSDKSSAIRQLAKPQSNSIVLTSSNEPDSNSTNTNNILTSDDIKKDSTEKIPESTIFSSQKCSDNTRTSKVSDYKVEDVSKSVPKKRKKMQKSVMHDNDLFFSDYAVINNVKKKPKMSNEIRPLSPSPVKFSFFGNLPPPIPPALASNPLVPKYTLPPSSIISTKSIEKSPINNFLPTIPGEDDYHLSNEIEPQPPLLVKEKKDIVEEGKKERRKSKKKKDKKDKKREKKRKKEEKMLGKILKDKSDSADAESNKDDISMSMIEEINTNKEEESLVPKIKLKLPGSNSSPTTNQRKIVIKPIVKNSKSPPSSNDPESHVTRTKLPKEERNMESIKSPQYSIKDDRSLCLSPNLPLQTEKKELCGDNTDKRSSKSSKKIPSVRDNFHNITPPANDKNEDTINLSSATKTILISPSNTNIKPNKTPKSKPSKKSSSKKSTAARQNVPAAFYYDEAGNQVWVCPSCTKRDDGSPMIGCDGCDAWYHWVCVGIQCPPDCAVWYCMTCLAVKRAAVSKRGRPPLKKKTSITSSL
ncbi:transcription initiation factor TFIID subunit 3-like [Daktulosphaira vitifoliae]|uniref:transcription initiation factor TFIID subunit 3-like n=1 Tax=Daktulosphaira vitifoliae TaxID=58002 RepID=UPI0021AAA618|nr:transcription initiation factor TFIID subunit 3-like [Daktulosphaira vitifoliae]